MIRVVGESGTKVIATGISSPAERTACLDAGCEMGQGPLFEERKRVDVSLRRANLGGTSPALDAFYLSQALDAIDRS
jgi:EAL domain-containing protein (putative c-di-GMP-specific phosphodiesterase class I)